MSTPSPEPLAADAAPRGLPHRVAERLRARQRQGENTITWVHMGFIGLLFLLWLISPTQAGTKMGTLEPVPTALAVFLAWSLIRLWLAARNRLGPVLIGVSIMVETACLMGLIWALHIEYQQPASFYLKAPTVGYAFLFVCVRALGLATWGVILSGVAAALAWAGLVLYALDDAAARPDGPAITHSFIEYMTSNAILIGAEMEKIIIFLSVTAVLTLVMTRYRSVLRHAATTERAVEDFSRFFDPLLAQRIARAERELEANEGEVREATVMMVDLRGFTRISEQLRPKELLRMLAEYQAMVIPIVERHQGAIDKFMGDGILVTFGIVSPSPDHARQALEAGQEVCEAAEKWQQTRRLLGLAAPGIGVGIATGEVLFGTIGHADRIEFTVIGEPVNRAAKLEAATKHAGHPLLVSDTTLTQARSTGWQGHSQTLTDDGHGLFGNQAAHGIEVPTTAKTVADKHHLPTPPGSAPRS